MSAVRALLIIIYFGISFSKKAPGRSVLGNDVEAAEESWVTVKAAKNEIQVTAGEVVELECEASGLGQPQIKFISESNGFKNGEVLSYYVAGHSKTALVKSIARTRLIPEQGQIIYCEASSGSQTARDSIKISVSHLKLHHFSSSLWSHRNPQDQLAFGVPKIAFFNAMYLDEMGNVAILPCRVQGEGKSKITWLNSMEEVIDADNNERYGIRSNGDLVIKDIQWSDLGTYTCVAKNKYGEDNVTTFLYPMALE